MLFQKEIHQINQLTKRFNRDCRKIFAQMQEDIKQTTMTKEEVKALIDSFGRIRFKSPIIIIFRPSRRHLGKPCQLLNPSIRRLPECAGTCKYCKVYVIISHSQFQAEEKTETESDSSISDCEVKE